MCWCKGAPLLAVGYIAVLRKYEILRAILVNGKEIGWGYEAPRGGIKKAIEEAR